MSKSPQRETLVQMRGIGKRFGNVSVLRQVDLDIHSHEVLVLAGENGAGKSTLIKILGGVYPDFEGTITIGDNLVRPCSPLEANALGIAVIYQELSLVPSMTVADNIFLGRSLTRGGFVDDRNQCQKAQHLLDSLGIDIDVNRRVEELPIAQQQLVEIAKALAQKARVIVMDEPTSSLNAPEVEKLFKLVDDLKSSGCGIIYITHKMEEIQSIADQIVVLRDGELVGSAPATEMTSAKLVEWMVGCSVDQQFPGRATNAGKECLRLNQFTVLDKKQNRRPLVDQVSLSVNQGEILGVAGLQGSGASDLFLALFGGHDRRFQGEAFLCGKPYQAINPREAINQGIALVTNDRKATGLVLPLSIIANTTLADLPRLSPNGWRSPDREQAVTSTLGRTLSLRTASLDLEVGALSGGNQQKVVLAKWLQVKPQLLLLDEPTRGIDVGAKREIYQLLYSLASEGIAIMLITSELPELIGLSDRICVMHRGRITAEFDRSNASAAKILEAAMGKTATQPS